MDKYKKVFKIFLAHQSDEEEKWLSDMSKQGYHLIGVNIFNYMFKIGEKKEYRYLIDLMNNDKKDTEYTNIYEDYGFEYIDNLLGFAYFRIEDSEESRKIIDLDKGRKFSRYKHHSKTLLLVSGLNLIIFFVNSFIIHPLGHGASISALNFLAALLCIWSYNGLCSKMTVLKEQIEAENKEILNDVNLYEWEKLQKLNVISIILIVIIIIMAVIKVIV